jgi:hypothetical protein
MQEGNMLSPRRGLARVVVVVAMALVACSGTQSNRGTIEFDNFSELYHFDRLSDMVETTAQNGAVIEGTVLSAEPGRFEEEDADFRYLAVTIRVESLLAGSLPSDRIVVEEVGWDEGQRLEIEFYPSSRPGQRAIFFIVESEGVPPYGPEQLPVYVLLSYSQGRYLIEGSRLEGAHVQDGLVQRIEAMGLNEAKARIRTLSPA